MARVPYTATPDTTPEIEAPQDYQHLESTPASFGAQTAEGTQALGAGIEKGVEFYGQVAADNATNNTLQGATAILHGDPNKPALDERGAPIMGPDGKPLPDTGFFGKRGADAMSAWPEARDALDQLIKDNRESLSTPQAKLQYDVESRRYRAQWMSQMSEYADNQQRVWATDTNNTGIALATNEAVRDAGNDQAANAVMGRAMDLATKNAQISGQDPAGARLRVQQQITEARIRSLMVDDKPGSQQRAQQILEQNAPVLGSMPNYDQLSRQVKESVANATFSPSVMEFMNSAKLQAQGQVSTTPAMAGAPSTQELQHAFTLQESNGNPNIPNSVNGAVGIGQIKPDTFAKYAHPGEDIHNPADNAAVQGRILDHYNKEYNGDIGRVAVAYFSGEGNVAPAGSPTPWIKDKADGNGKTTSSYVANIEARLAKYPSSADALIANSENIHDEAVAYAANKPEWKQYPDLQGRFVATVDRETDQSVAQLHREYDVNSHVVQEAMVTQHPISEEDLKSISPEVANAWEKMQAENPWAAQNMANRMFDANAHGAARTYGMGFKSMLDRALGPRNDPNFLNNPAAAAPYIGKGDDAVLTNTGAGMLGRLMQMRSGPGGEANAQAAKSFIDQIHGELTFSNTATGVFDDKGEARFTKYMAVALPIIEQAAKNHNLGDVLNPQSKNYVGLAAAPFMRSPAQVVRDRQQYDNEFTGLHHPLMQGPAFTVQTLDQTMSSLDNDQQRQDFLNDAKASGRLTKDVYTAWHNGQMHNAAASSAGFIAPPTPHVGVVPHGAPPNTNMNELPFTELGGADH